GFRTPTDGLTAISTMPPQRKPSRRRATTPSAAMPATPKWRRRITSLRLIRSAREEVLARKMGRRWDGAPANSLLQVQFCKFALVGGGKIESGGQRGLFFCLVTLAGIDQRFGPFQMEVPPVGRVFVGFRKFQQRQVR